MAESAGYNQPTDKRSLALGEENATVQQPPAYAPPSVVYPNPQPYCAPSSSQQMSSTNTTVVVNQPRQQNIKMPRDWSTGVCACCDHVGICLCGAFCQCCLASEVSQDMGESSCVPCCVPGWLISLRLKMRIQENIPGSLLDDCCTVCCCGVCVLCQLAREIRFVKMADQTRQLQAM
ncbi:cornifelin homolog [Aplysia californica]|uniref:Cornifelin homolog n=1 Tax=Aplysia californica TaxID=6500 RepID=A0ABM0K856_APLCA|nr:cornifelin homolog [Aplysia californica]